ncbi:hypothetical protein ACFLQW_00165 [Candidatus Zixiibacteriota bacterium]
MFIYLIAILVILYSIDRLRQSARDTRVEEYRYRLYAVRDKLREMAINEEVSSDYWLFAYLDSSIAKTISILPKFSIWRVLAMYYAYKNDPRISAARNHLNQSLAKPQNRLFTEIHGEFLVTTVRFLVGRHIPMIGVSLMTAAAYSWIDRKLRSVTEVATETPEASTLNEFCPQPT